MRRILATGVALALSSPGLLSAQQVFHSIQSANLPTAEMLPQGSWLFEISHRFDTPFSEGGDALWGIDGPVYNRLGLTYAATDRVLLVLQRTNVEDNTELSARVGVGSAGGVKAALVGGFAVNTQPFPGAEDNETQAYAQLLLNALVGGQLAIGVVPSYLRNPNLRATEAGNAFALGVHGQLYVSPSMSLLAEWLVAEEQPESPNDAASFGIELQTRGHFFKLLVTNQARLNPTQFLAGSDEDFEPNEWRAGFNLTRLLPF